jgi:ubiquinone/menaquinone biosynthesis C-methylase UbiE
MKAFYERYWDRDAELEDFHYKWPIIKHLVPTTSAISILDFGCGKGKILHEMTKINPKADYTGVDVSQNGLNTAKKVIKKAKFALIADGGKLPFKDNSFDFVTALDVLEHVYDTHNAFAELARVLNPNGKILISVPYNGLLKNLIIILFFYEFIYNPYSPHIRFFTKKSMTSCLADVKLQPERFGYYGRVLPF